MQEEYLELIDPETGRVLKIYDQSAIKWLEIAHARVPEAVNDMLVDFVNIYSDRTDEEISAIITEFMLNGVQKVKARYVFDRAMQGLFSQPSRARRRIGRIQIPKVKIQHKDYAPLLPLLIKQTRLFWLETVTRKLISPESLRNLRLRLRSIRTTHTDNKEAERIYRKLESFMADLKIAIKRFEASRQKKSAVAIPIHHPKRKLQKEAPESNRKASLLKQVGEICPFDRNHYVTRLSNNKLDRLLMILRVLNGNQDAHSKLLAMSGLELALSNHSPLMLATSQGDLAKMIGIINDAPEILSNESSGTTTVEWDQYRFHPKTTIRLIIASCVDSNSIITMLRGIADNVILINLDNARSIKAASKSKDIIVLPTEL